MDRLQELQDETKALESLLSHPGWHWVQRWSLERQTALTRALTNPLQDILGVFGREYNAGQVKTLEIIDAIIVSHIESNKVLITQLLKQEELEEQERAHQTAPEEEG